MQAMYKNELAKLAGVSNRTFQRYLATRRPILTAMGVSPFARKLPPPAVRFISEDYCIDLPPPNVMSSVVETSPCHLDQRGEISRLTLEMTGKKKKKIFFQNGLKRPTALQNVVILQLQGQNYDNVY